MRVRGVEIRPLRLGGAFQARSPVGTFRTCRDSLTMSAHRGTSGNPHGGRASRAAYAILDDFDMDQCTNEQGVGINVDSHFME
jgi:hypothetical protein